MKKNFTFIFFLGLLLLAFVPVSSAGVYTDTIHFDPDAGIFWNYPWQQCVSDLPAGEHVDSVQVQLRAKVFSSGYYPPALLISDTNVFYAGDPDYHIDYLALRSSFYNNNYTLTPTQIAWLANDGCAFFEVLSNGGTYYLDTCLLTVVTSILPCQGDLYLDKAVDEQDLQLLADYFGRDDCVGDCLGDFSDDGDVDGTDLFAFASEFGRDNCP